MHIMSSLEYSRIIEELLPKIIGKHFSRIRKIGENAYRIKIGDIEVYFELGVRMNATKYIERIDERESMTDKISKELDNVRLVEIEQPNKDRLIVLKFSNMYQIIFEMFGKGNMILVKEGSCICAHRYEDWSDRSIRAGKEYKFPKSTTAQSIEYTDKYIIVSLMKLPLGKGYAIEAIERSKIDEKDRGDGLSKEKRAALEENIKNIINENKPRIYMDAEGRPQEFALLKLSKYSKNESTIMEFTNLNEAADHFYNNYEKKDPEVEKLENRLAKQYERRIELETEASEYTKKGDWIYSNYETVEQLIELAKNKKFEEIERKHKTVQRNMKEKSVELETVEK
ncbi:NFACT family protein [Candidatus Micrarchaeota archaeon]|nr:NFACT family protein [Candidatus Micrarchaeota archaeon]